jgi:hypothetical protein
LSSIKQTDFAEQSLTNTNVVWSEIDMASTTTQASGDLRELFYTEDEARRALPRPVSKPTWLRWRREGKGPPITPIGRFIFIRKTSFAKWLEGREVA